jgi:hypothetical protein
MLVAFAIAGGNDEEPSRARKRRRREGLEDFLLMALADPMGLRGIVERLANTEETGAALLLAPRADHAHGAGPSGVEVTPTIVTNFDPTTLRFPRRRLTPVRGCVGHAKAF